MSADRYMRCPICKEKAEKIFEKEKKSKELSFEQLKILEKVVKGFNYKYNFLKEIRKEHDNIDFSFLYNLEDKHDTRFMPYNESFKSIEIYWEYMIEKDKFRIDFHGKCSICDTVWKMEDETKTKKEKK